MTPGTGLTGDEPKPEPDRSTLLWEAIRQRAPNARLRETQAVALVKRAIIRPPAGKLKNPSAAPAATSAAVDTNPPATVAAAMHIPVRNGATYRCSTAETFVIPQPLVVMLEADTKTNPCGKTMARRRSLFESKIILLCLIGEMLWLIQ